MCGIKQRPEESVSVNYKETKDTDNGTLKDKAHVVKREIADAREVSGKDKRNNGVETIIKEIIAEDFPKLLLKKSGHRVKNTINHKIKKIKLMKSKGEVLKRIREQMHCLQRSQY